MGQVSDYYGETSCNCDVKIFLSSRDTGVPFHHLITWQDLRAQKYVNEWNNCLKLKVSFFAWHYIIHYEILVYTDTILFSVITDKC